jgi:CDP-diacylglycerol--glycerol-3-phosphate 3-phosphatidyltransferase
VEEFRGSPIVPRLLSDTTLRLLDRAAMRLVTWGITPNAVTASSLVVAAVAGMLLATGYFALATAAMVVASLGDALDGLVARRSGAASVGGALFDASADRYGEFFFLSGLAVHFRDSVPALVLALFALVGSFMVSYGSAKAEALRIPVPPGIMRRAERAVCICLGVGLATVLGWLARSSLLPAWAGVAPIGLSLGILAVVGNASAIRRLCALSRRLAPPAPAPLPREHASASPAHATHALRTP